MILEFTIILKQFTFIYDYFSFFSWHIFIGYLKDLGSVMERPNLKRRIQYGSYV